MSVKKGLLYWKDTSHLTAEQGNIQTILKTPTNAN